MSSCGRSASTTTKDEEEEEEEEHGKDEDGAETGDGRCVSSSSWCKLGELLEALQTRSSEGLAKVTHLKWKREIF